MTTTDDKVRYTLGRDERIKSRKLIDRLFKGERQGVTCYPIRALFVEREPIEGQAQVNILVSVSKRKFKRAVHRNRVKRLLREAYRLNKHILTECMQDTDRGLSIAFIWMSSELPTSEAVTAGMRNSLDKIKKKLCSEK